MNNTHLTQEIIEKFYNGTLSSDESQNLLLHISDCEECAGHFADFIEAHSQVSAPRGMREQVENKIHTHVHELFIYTLKVAAACAAAIAITFSGVCSYDMQQLKGSDISTLQQNVEQKLNSFSQNILNGGFFNAGQKK